MTSTQVSKIVGIPKRRLVPDLRTNGSESIPKLLPLARLWGVDRRALAVRARLHLPLYADDIGRVSYRAAVALVAINASRLRKDQRAVRDLIPRRPYSLTDLHFQEDVPDAERIFRSMHYLRSARANSLNFALVAEDTGAPLTLCSASPLDWRRVGDELHSTFGVPQASVWDISRVYSFDGSPANAVSSLLAQVRKYFQKSRPEVELLTTAVDPNLGFTGSSYLASNWQHWMTVQARPYLYYKRKYMSLREMRVNFPAVRSIAQLCSVEGKAEQSTVPLQNSMIFCCRVRGATEPVHPDKRPHIDR